MRISFIKGALATVLFTVTAVPVSNAHPLHPEYGVFTGMDTRETALYNLAIDEMVQNIEDDGTFRTGELWGGVWTRDISYSIILSLAHVEPVIARNSLLCKIDSLGRIVQDTGTGGAWPCSIDREIWTVAAYELWLETGDPEWLKTAYSAASRSMDDDLFTAFDRESGMFRGESSFIDWRSQSYPVWMDCKDIASSECLGTNAVFVAALKCLAGMAAALGKTDDESRYAQAAADLSAAINDNLWMEDRGYYAQYSYGRTFRAISPRSETLGESLCILYGVADGKKASSIIGNMPVSAFGPTIFWPQIAWQKPYHNNAVWPFVTSFYGLASAAVGSWSGIRCALESNESFAYKYGTNYENMVSFDGSTATCTNSHRQLWSIAGFIALYRRLLLGIEYGQDGIRFRPSIPEGKEGTRTLEGLKYRNMLLDICVEGSGSVISGFTLDGSPSDDAFVPDTLVGRHKVVINVIEDPSHVDIPVPVRPYTVDLPTPETVLEGRSLKWTAIDNAMHYKVLRNGRELVRTTDTSFKLRRKGEYSVIAVSPDGVESFMSEPCGFFKTVVSGEFEQNLNRSGSTSAIEVRIKRSGTYSLKFLYSNGNGEIEYHNKCATRTLYVDGNPCGAVVMPQRGTDWNDRGWSTCLNVKLHRGRHRMELRYPEQNINMNIEEDRAVVHSVCLVRTARR